MEQQAPTRKKKKSKKKLNFTEEKKDTPGNILNLPYSDTESEQQEEENEEEKLLGMNVSEQGVEDTPGYSRGRFAQGMYILEDASLTEIIP